jgi:hypothetical protein
MRAARIMRSVSGPGFVDARRLRDKRKTPLFPAGPFLSADAA